MTWTHTVFHPVAGPVEEIAPGRASALSPNERSGIAPSTLKALPSSGTREDVTGENPGRSSTMPVPVRSMVTVLVLALLTAAAPPVAEAREVGLLGVAVNRLTRMESPFKSECDEFKENEIVFELLGEGICIDRKTLCLSKPLKPRLFSFDEDCLLALANPIPNETGKKPFGRRTGYSCAGGGAIDAKPAMLSLGSLFNLGNPSGFGMNRGLRTMIDGYLGRTAGPFAHVYFRRYCLESLAYRHSLIRKILSRYWYARKRLPLPYGMDRRDFTRPRDNTCRLAHYRGTEALHDRILPFVASRRFPSRNLGRLGTFLSVKNDLESRSIQSSLLKLYDSERRNYRIVLVYSIVDCVAHPLARPSTSLPAKALFVADVSPVLAYSGKENYYCLVYLPENGNGFFVESGYRTALERIGFHVESRELLSMGALEYVLPPDEDCLDGMPVKPDTTLTPVSSTLFIPAL